MFSKPMYRRAENRLRKMPKPSASHDRDESPQVGSGDPTPVRQGGTQETVPKRRRRVFSPADKLRIVKEAEACLGSGQRGAVEALLRREAIYSSNLSSWRTQLEMHGVEGLAARKPGRKARLTAGERQNEELMKRNAELERRLRIANAVISLQKKAHEVLGLALPESDGDS